MSSQPGKDETRPGAGRTGGGPGSADTGGSAAGAAPKRTVAASAAKPGRDEATVEIPQAEETKTDLPKIEADADQPEIAPVRDTPGEPDDAADPPGWARPTEPAASVSSRRAEASGLSFGAGEPAADAGNSTGPASSGSMNSGSNPSASAGVPGGGTSRFGGGFAGNVLRNSTGTASSSPSSGSGPGTGPGAGAGTGAAKATGAKTARKAQLQLARLEPWSVMKFSFVMSLVCFVVLLVAVVVLYTILSGLGVFSAITDTVSDLTRRQGETSGGLDAASWFSFARVFGYTVLVGALNVLLITALSTVGSVIYNLAADLVGGVEVTLKEAE